jgi:hypothetical protein
MDAKNQFPGNCGRGGNYSSQNYSSREAAALLLR